MLPAALLTDAAMYASLSIKPAGQQVWGLVHRHGLESPLVVFATLISGACISSPERAFVLAKEITT